MNKNISLPRIVNWLVILSLIWVNFNTNLYKRDGKVIMNDVVEYYTYLPALFVYHDITLKFTEKNPGYYGDKFWPIPAPNGGHVTKMSMGMAMLYSPFFFAAHITAKLTGLEANGFSPIYKLALQMSCLFYRAIGLYFLRRLLQRYFNDVVTSSCQLGGSFNGFVISSHSSTMPLLINNPSKGRRLVSCGASCSTI